jgi:hypothetical protein
MRANSNGQGVGTLAAKNIEAEPIVPQQLALTWEQVEIRRRWAGLCAQFRAEYRAWWNMLRRCTDPKCGSWKHYGGRGITVCARWTDSFENFLSDVSPRPCRGYSLDRIDNDGNYEPGNVRWATPYEQSTNRRNNRWLEAQGARRTMAEWARVLGVDPGALSWRLRAGASLEDLLKSGITLKARRPFFSSIVQPSSLPANSLSPTTSLPKQSIDIGKANLTQRQPTVSNRQQLTLSRRAS